MQVHINSYRESDKKEPALTAQSGNSLRSTSIEPSSEKAWAYFLGADIVGICEASESAYYTHDTFTGKEITPGLQIRHCFCSAARNTHTSKRSNGYDWIFDAVSFQTYQRLAMQTETMANYIRQLGHEAEASNMYNYLTLMPELVLRAGLGEVSRMGIILNPFLGANYKSAAVLTNLELETDKFIDFGLQDFCEKLFYLR